MKTFESETTDQVEKREAVQFSPRFLRFRDAPRYLGMDRNRFNCEVRPQVTVIRIGIQGIAFDRIELDEWADNYKTSRGRRR